MEAKNVGILGVGAYLPSDVRTNAWWPTELVARWENRKNTMLPEEAALAKNEGERLVIQATQELADDPFCGARERRVAPDSMMASEMETLAGKEALERAGVRAEQVDGILAYSLVPDHLTTPNAAAVHSALGLPRSCLALSIEAACNSFHMQVSIGAQMIRSGQARYVLCVQSSQMPKLIPKEVPASSWFGDGATAVVLGPVRQGHGLLAEAHRTEGSYHDVFVTSPRDRRWFEDGAMAWHPTDRVRARKFLLGIPELAREVVTEALDKAGVGANEVGFYAAHQATPWFRRVTQEYCGLMRAKALDTYAWAGSLSACNVPLVLSLGEREGLLRPGDLVATFSGGSGLTVSSLVLRWGA